MSQHCFVRCVFISLMRAIFFVNFDSKYYYTSSSCRLKSGALQTFSAGPKYKKVRGSRSSENRSVLHVHEDLKNEDERRNLKFLEVPLGFLLLLFGGGE